MATTVTHSIGTASRDYSTLQAWEDACPANLVTADQIWRGECYNDSEFTVASATMLTIAGETTDSTRYVELTVATGQSFQDNARTNALTYNQTNGVGCRSTADYSTLVTTTVSYVRISRIQFKVSSGSHAGGVTALATGCIAKDIFIYTSSTSASGGLRIQGTADNCVVFVAVAGGSATILLASAAKAIGGGIARTTDQAASGTGYTTSYGSNVIQSCFSFGFTTCASASGWDTTNSKNNGTDAPSGFPGSTGNQYSIPYTATTPLTQAGVTGLDLRSIAATTLAGNGFLDATNAPNDISGYARPAGPTIGHWQIATTSAVQQRLSLMGVGS